MDNRCPRCSNGALSRFVHRELVILLILGGMTTGLFLATQSMASAHRDLRQRDAAQWFRHGRAELAANRPRQAVQMLRRAASLDPHSLEYRLALAGALEAEARPDAARQLLLELRSDAPERPDINTRLARLEAHRGDESAAIRYYQNALYGVWSDSGAEVRRQLRGEFIRYLLHRHHTDRALAELIAVEGSFGDEPSSHRELGDLFLEAGDAQRALVQYRAALRRTPHDEAALSGAAKAAFGLGDYRATLRFIRGVRTLSKEMEHGQAVASLVLTRDPLLPRLSYVERRRRLLLNLRDAKRRLMECMAAGQPPTLTALQAEIAAAEAEVQRKSVRERLESIEEGVDVVRRAVQAATEQCGATTPLDHAHLLIGQRHRLDIQ